MPSSPPPEPSALPPVSPYSWEDLDASNTDSTLDQLEAARLQATSPVLLAQFLETLEVEERRVLLRHLAEAPAAAILAEMDAEAAAEVLTAMRQHRAVRILQDFDPDDATDVVSEMEQADQERLLGLVDPSTADTLKQLLEYDPETAGGVMTPEVVTVRPDMTVDAAIESIRRQRDGEKDFTYVYAVDGRRRLRGLVPLRSLILARPLERIGAIMATEVKGLLAPDTDREKVARIMAETNLLALPVVDRDQTLLGMVTHDDVVDILQEEATEDFQVLVGAGRDEAVGDPVFYSLRRRLPWLNVNLFTASCAAGVIFAFQDQIGAQPFLAVLLPIVASMGGNAGMQALAVIIRGLALDVQGLTKGGRPLRKELALGLLNGFGVGLVAAAVSLLIAPAEMRTDLAIVIFVSMTLTLAVAGFLGAFIPLLLRRFKLDPAQSASIFLTTLTDLAGFFIFLSLGRLILG